MQHIAFHMLLTKMLTTRFTHRVFQFTVLLCVNLVVSILVSSMWKAMCCMLTLIAKYVLSQFDKAQQDEGNLV